MIYFKNAIRVLFPFLICFFTACSSLDKEPRKKARKRKKPEISQSTRDVANIQSEAFLGESGLDFLSKKLEDTISGYKGLQEKILGLEERLSKLIFLLEAKAHAVAEEDTDEEDLLIEAEEVLPYEEEEEKSSEEEKSKKQKLSKEKKSKTEKTPDPNKNVVSKSSGE